VAFHEEQELPSEPKSRNEYLSNLKGRKQRAASGVKGFGSAENPVERYTKS